MASRGTYPAPPPYFHLYTDASRDDVELWSPPPPILPPASFFKFGEQQTGTYYQHELPLLPGQDGPHRCPQLFAEVDGKIDFVPELRRLIRSSLDKYIELLNCLMVVKENQVEHKVNEISHIFFNITHLLNLLRPHQARQMLISFMVKQVKQRNDKALELETLANNAQNFLNAHGVDLTQNDVQLSSSSASIHIDEGAERATLNSRTQTTETNPELENFTAMLSKLSAISDEG